MVCSLCGSQSIRLKEVIRTQELNRLYMRRLGVDISNELTDNNSFNYYECLECGLLFFTPPLTGSESFYSQLQGFEWYYQDIKDEYEFAKSFVSKDNSVLEIGCGKAAFAHLIPTQDYTGLDFSSNAKLMAAANGVTIHNYSIEEFSQMSTSDFDIVCCFQVLEHVATPYSFIKSQVDILKPNGLLIISVPSADSFLNDDVNNPLNMPPHHITHWRDLTLTKCAGLFGLRLIQLHHGNVEPIHKKWYHWTQIVKLFNKNQLLNNSGLFRVFSKTASILINFISPILQIPSQKNGHTVTAVYRKI